MPYTGKKTPGSYNKIQNILYSWYVRGYYPSSINHMMLYVTDEQYPHI